MSEQTNRDYINDKVNPILEQLVTDLLTDKPDDPLLQMLTWLHHRKGDDQIGDSSSSKDKEEIMQLKKKIKELESKNDIIKQSDDENDNDDSSGSDFMSDDEMEKMMLTVKTNPKKSRVSISAEAYGEFNKPMPFIPRVINKSEDTKSKIREKIKQSFMFNSIGTNEQEVLINAMEEMKFSDNEQVIKEGDDGNAMYMVEKGELSCQKRLKPEDENDTFLLNQKPGEIFGELALLYNAPRAASIYSIGESMCYALDRECFNNIVILAQSNRRQKWDDFIKNVDLLKDMNENERIRISDAFQTHEYKADDYVINQGEDGHSFFILEEGKAKAQIDDKCVMDYKKGDQFGELSLIRNQPRAASVRAVTNIKVVSLDRGAFKRLLGPLEEILKRNVDRQNDAMSKLNM